MTDPLEILIVDQVKKILAHNEYKKWTGGQQLKANGIILINNSFVFRDVKTTKAVSYVGVRLDNNLGPILPPVISGSPTRLNSDFKYLTPSPSLPQARTLTDAIKDEKRALGELIYVLIGEIKDELIETEDITNCIFKEIAWDPKLGDKIVINSTHIEIGQVHDEDVIWDALVRHFTDLGESVPDGLRSAVGVALDKLQQKAAAQLNIPKKGAKIGSSITDQIIMVLEEQTADYEKALKRVTSVPGDANARNEILRLAYNFASDAMGYLRLIVCVCDLKPIVLWGTLFDHYELSETFKSLPWTRSRDKASLKNYVETISDARNSAFHNIFPFRKSLNVPLTAGALANAELRIFSEHGKKTENELSFRDKELVEVLTEFTRARERRANR